MSFKFLYKTIIKTISLTGFGLSSLISLAPPSKAENFNMQACPEPGSANATLTYINNTLEGECLHTPDQYKLTIYEMGLCESDPISTGIFNKIDNNCVQTMLSTSGTEVDLAPGNSSSKTAGLPTAATRPAAGNYSHAYILLSNAFKMKGSYQLADGTTYYSKAATDGSNRPFGAADTSISAGEEHTDLVDNMYFGDEENGWDGVMSATDMPGGGKVAALLLKECVDDTCVGPSAIATSQTEVGRLLGVFETNSGSPVVISDASTGIEVELIVKADPNDPSNSGGGYLLIGWDEGSGFDLRMFGSAPFKPKFTTF